VTKLEHTLCQKQDNGLGSVRYKTHQSFMDWKQVTNNVGESSFFKELLVLIFKGVLN